MVQSIIILCPVTSVSVDCPHLSVGHHSATSAIATIAAVAVLTMAQQVITAARQIPTFQQLGRRGAGVVLLSPGSRLLLPVSHTAPILLVNRPGPVYGGIWSSSWSGARATAQDGTQGRNNQNIVIYLLIILFSQHCNEVRGTYIIKPARSAGACRAPMRSVGF